MAEYSTAASPQQVCFHHYQSFRAHGHKIFVSFSIWLHWQQPLVSQENQWRESMQTACRSIHNENVTRQKGSWLMCWRVHCVIPLFICECWIKPAVSCIQVTGNWVQVYAQSIHPPISSYNGKITDIRRMALLKQCLCNSMPNGNYIFLAWMATTSIKLCRPGNACEQICAKFVRKSQNDTQQNQQN